MADKVAFKFDPFELVGVEPPKTGAREAKQQIAEYIVQQVIEYCGDGKSPVAGGAWKRTLSAAYRKLKVAQGGNSYADMILDGDMLKDLECVITRDGDLELRIKGPQAAKADGHNNHSGASSLPAREFIPKDGGSFKAQILAGMRSIAAEFFDGE